MDSASLAEIVRSHEPVVRLVSYLSVTAVVAVWETLMPRRVRVLPRLQRWPGNLGIAAVNTLAVRLIPPAAAVNAAEMAAERGWGLFNLIALPFWTAIVLSVVLLDLVIYAQHVLFHTVPPLWRVHRMHHSDLDMDVSTGVRFHPIEIILSAFLKVGAVMTLGAPVLAVVLFEVLLNAVTLFNHGNILMPAAVDHVLRWVVVTPDMHRVHHSVLPRETNSNFGFNLPWWDRLFGTYGPQQTDDHDRMILGLPTFRAPSEHRLDHLLAQPFRGLIGPN